MTREGDDDGQVPAGKPAGKLRRRQRRPSVLGGEATEPAAGRPDADAAAPTDAPSARSPAADEPHLSRTERRKRTLAASDRPRELSPRQKKLLGIDATDDGAALPETRPPPEPRRPPSWQRHDLAVVAGFGLIAAAGALLHADLAAPRLEPFRRHGLALARPDGWLPPVAVPAPPLRLAPDAPLADGAPGGAPPYHVVFAAPLDPLVAIDVRIEPAGAPEHVEVALGLARAARYGEAYWAATTASETLGGHDWRRTRFRYAAKIAGSSAPLVASGIEYAAVQAGLAYVVTFHGDDASADELADLIAPTLALAAPAAPPARTP